MTSKEHIKTKTAVGNNEGARLDLCVKKIGGMRGLEVVVVCVRDVNVDINLNKTHYHLSWKFDWIDTEKLNEEVVSKLRGIEGIHSDYHEGIHTHLYDMHKRDEVYKKLKEFETK